MGMGECIMAGRKLRVRRLSGVVESGEELRVGGQGERGWRASLLEFWRGLEGLESPESLESAEPGDPGESAKLVGVGGWGIDMDEAVDPFSGVIGCQHGAGLPAHSRVGRLDED
jgi:hypothetical protein